MGKRLTVTALVIVLTGCTDMKVEQFAGSEPQFALESYFAGKTRAWGIFEDRFGNLRRQFTVDIVGTVDGNVLTLDESFYYRDGETEHRVWTITKLDDHTYEGRANGIIGTARGQVFGNTLNWRYEMDLKVGDGQWRVRFDDWMFLQPDGVLINRAYVSRWGIEIGAVTLAFMKAEDQQVGAADAPQVAAE